MPRAGSRAAAKNQSPVLRRIDTGLSLIILLVLLLLGAFPRDGAYSADWGRGPAGLLGLILVIVLILVLLEYIPHNRFGW